jgi:molybdopterin molybdotransferase
MAQVLECGAIPMNLGVARDDPAVIEARVRQAADADVVVSSAGVSVGDLDFVKAALESAGAQLHLWRVSMRPGKPITFGSLHGRPVFGLPGNPVSAMVTYELFVRPALLAMMGGRVVHRARVTARAGARIANPGHRRGYLRVALGRDRDGFIATLTGDQGSGILRSMVAADGLAVVPPDTVIEHAERVEVIVLRPLDRH